MTAYADLELGLLGDLQGWSIQLRFNQPGGAPEVAFHKEDAFRLDLAELRENELDPDAYGRLLGERLFADPDVSGTFDKALTVAAAEGVILRLRLLLPPSARELHDVRWETLQAPDGRSLATDENVVLSRYLASTDWRRVPLQSRDELEAAIVIANPRSDDTYGGKAVDPIDVPAELERARSCLGPIEAPTVLADVAGATGRATFPMLTQLLQDGVDVLYIVCHGYVHDGEPQLLLENDEGGVQIVSGRRLVDDLGRLHRLPRLIVLVSCQSAGTGDTEPKTADDGALAALGPRMARAGVPAVMAMQGNVSMATMAAFLPLFFRELNRDGEIDRAVAIARHAVRDRPDWWMPVLFMRLISGRVWYTPGFVKDDDFEKWPALIGHIRDGRCTPVLGIGLTDSVLGSRQDIARRWAQRYRYPLADHDRDDLPQVAQYVSTNQDDAHVRRELGDYLRSVLVDRYPEFAPVNLGQGTLPEMLRNVWNGRREHSRDDPFSVLARLPFPMYVTTHTSTLLEDALRAEGRWDDDNPAVAFCEWKESIRVALVDLRARAGVRAVTRAAARRLPHGQRRDPDAQGPDVARHHGERLLQLPDRGLPQPGRHPLQRAHGARQRFADVPRLPAAGLGLPGAVPHDHEATRRRTARRLRPRRRPDRSGERPDGRPGAGPPLPRALPADRSRQCLLGHRRRLRRSSEQGVGRERGMSAPATEAPTTNPFVGPHALSEHDELFGRTLEVRMLRDLVIAERIVLLYSPSGAGKTSLLHAGLKRELIADGFAVLPTVRVTHEATDALGDTTVRNRYSLSTLLSLEAGRDHEMDPTALATITLDQYLEQTRESRADGGQDCLFFDQFEELFTADPIDVDAKREFLAELGEALRNRSRWAIISMREDFAAHLDPYLKLFPTRLRATFRLDLLGPQAARAAIQGPMSAAGVTFDDAAATALVDDLRTVQVQRGSERVDEPGLTVEPVQLQVVCRRLWSLLNGATAITTEHMSELGDVDHALRDFYDEVVGEVVAATGVRERVLRAWVSDELITEQGYRDQVQHGPPDDTRGAVLPALEDAHLVRADRRRNTVWYELAHDRLVDPIRHSNDVWLDEHLSDLQRGARTWEDQRRNDRALFVGADLQAAEAWATEHPEEVGESEEEFLAACHDEQQRIEKDARTRRRTRILAIAMTAVAILAVGALVFSFVQWRSVEDQKDRAEAVEASSAYFFGAQSRELDYDIRPRLLLDAMALETLPDDAAPSAHVVRGINTDRFEGYLALSSQSDPVSEAIGATAMSADGSTLAVTTPDGVRVIDLDGAEPDRIVPVVLGEEMLPAGEALALDSDGSTLAFVPPDGGVVQLWDIAAGTEQDLEAAAFIQPYTLSLSFAGDGRRVARRPQPAHGHGVGRRQRDRGDTLLALGPRRARLGDQPVGRARRDRRRRCRPHQRPRDRRGARRRSRSAATSSPSTRPPAA